MQSQLSAPEIKNTAAIHHRILKRIGLTLTGDQQNAIDEICEDLQKPTAMNRLLQGDVGTGKTAVAVYAMLLAVANGYQATLMTPTEILARQHFDRLSKSLTGANCETALLVGSMTNSEKSDLQTKIAIGTVDVVIGTQALLSDKVEFQKLGLAVIDEQHKFGVAQRAKLRGVNIQPHYLVLSATPIPRTLAMTAFGDLDVSTIREKPAGRATVHTYLSGPGELASWWKFFREKIIEGRQGYVISPRVEGDEANEIVGATTIYEQLTKKELQGLRIGLLHGRIEPHVKNETLKSFENGQIDVLVSTTMVEVGIDVANATVMTILDADRMGLAQLHQLRGRVGRGHQAGYVCIFPKSNADEDALEKLTAFAKIADGFELAELDMRLRGPGNLLGTQQTGVPTFRIADILRDKDALELAREVAMQIIREGEGLDALQYANLKRQVMARHGGMIDFGDVA
jgi:ATP-dependent DNA helicase RecG